MRRESGGMERLFFALWPDGAEVSGIRSVQESLRGRLRGRWIRPANFHVTLAFLGAVPVASLGLLQDMAGGVETRGFILRLDRLAWWRHAGVLCLTATHCPEPLAAMVSALQGTFGILGIPPDSRGFRPHLTLARDVRGLPDDIEMMAPALQMTPRSFSLVASRTAPTGSVYERLAEWSIPPPIPCSDGRVAPGL